MHSTANGRVWSIGGTVGASLVIKTFLFDMGNVLLHFSHERMCRQVGAVCGQTETEMKGLLIDAGWNADFESGTLSPDEFRGRFEKQFKRSIDRQALARAASDIFTLNEPIVPVLEELKSRGHRLVLLSNTSVFHFDFIQERFDVLRRFDDFVLSYEVKSLKPHPDIYDAAIKKIQCAPPDCFYTDDIPPYVEAGRRHGLDAEVFTDVANLKRHLAARGIHLSDSILV